MWENDGKLKTFKGDVEKLSNHVTMFLPCGGRSYNFQPLVCRHILRVKILNHISYVISLRKQALKFTDDPHC